jgi:hypothetical protein
MAIKRQYAWSLWHGQTGIGLSTVKEMHERLGIPLEELIQLDPPHNPKPRKRPSSARQPKSSHEEGPSDN